MTSAKPKKRMNKVGRPATGLTGKMMSFRLPFALLDRIERYRLRHPYNPERTQLMIFALEQFLDKEEAKK